MRILIDECLDWRLGRALTGQDCVSVQKMGWGGVKNGKLLALPQEEFDVFLTADPATKNVPSEIKRTRPLETEAAF
jgi:hypothetical protein